jgi:hypothetical protein
MQRITRHVQRWLKQAGAETVLIFAASPNAGNNGEQVAYFARFYLTFILDRSHQFVTHADALGVTMWV